jgi:hypothetical protein
MKNLAVADGKGKGKGEAKPAEAGAAVEKKKAVVKVDAGDVALLVSLRLFATLSVGEREEKEGGR